MVTTNPKPITDAQQIKGKKAKHNTTESHQPQGKRLGEETAERNYKNNQKTTNKMARIYLSITTLNVNSTNAPLRRHRVVERIKQQ